MNKELLKEINAMKKEMARSVNQSMAQDVDVS